MYNKTLTYRIKKIQLTLIFVLILISSLNVKAQHNLDHPRGMYVNRFFCFNRNTTNRNINTSILGNIQKENELLQYASDNHITYLILFDVPKIFSTFGTSQWSTYSDMLSNFICKAKTTYCIQKIGVALGKPSDMDVTSDFNNISTPPFNFNPPEQQSPQYSQLSYVSQTYQTTHELFKSSEFTKMILRMAYFSDPNYEISQSVCINNNIDVLTLEYEFWNGGKYYSGSGPSTDPGNNLQDKVLHMDLVKNIYNSGHLDELYTELYLGNLDDAPGNTPYDNHCSIAQWVDGMYNSTSRRIDRFLTTYYNFYINNIYDLGGVDANYECRFMDFSESNNYSSSPAVCSSPIVTNNHTDVHPLFSAEDPFKGGDRNSAYLGQYLGARYDDANVGYNGMYSEQNIFAVEKAFYDFFQNGLIIIKFQKYIFYN